ncbi:MAG TPA: excinuclease ABC subunit UvrC [Candidatus Limnocylindria bacterium]|nr:excinuclease ABC subunit UvrC [Candidatus Limnocylindria bacterium]
MPVTDQIRDKLSQLPHKPGVYLMKDRFGTVIYVGKARDLRKRVTQYFHPARRLGWDIKFNALVDAIYDLDVHTVRSEPEAMLLEGKLIKEFHPRYNVSFRDDKRFLLVKVNLNDPIPRFTLTRFKQDDGARYFGPFPNAGALRSTLTLVRRQFNLRGCRPLTPTEADYKHCLYGHLKFCTAPCVGNVTHEQYKEQVLAACEFMSGQCEEMEEHLDGEMRKAALNQKYEKAAELRDTITAMRRTTQKTTRFERTPWNLPVSVMPERDNLELGKVLNLPAAPVRVEGFDISNISGTFAVASIVAFKNGRPDRANYRRMKMKTVVGQDDFACIAEAVRRRYSRLLREANGETTRENEEDRALPDELRTLMKKPWEAFPKLAEEEARPAAPAKNVLNVYVSGEDGSLNLTEVPTVPATPSNMPDLIVIDGGKGQLNAACAELEKLGLKSIPVIGLAKEFEEIYFPGEKEPLRLSHESSALKLLQRIRDESHRVANSYNAQLRVKKISESILDEFPGIGDRRKAALLKKFGSVQRLRMASVEEIAIVPGFGGKAAGELKTFLDARSGELLEKVVYESTESSEAEKTALGDLEPRDAPRPSASDGL